MNRPTAKKLPHPFPYQGSKRALAARILTYFPRTVECLYEPFCGAAAVSIAAANRGYVNSFHLNDINAPLMALWHEILHNPEELSKQYETLWNAQHPDRKEFFFEIRNQFNDKHEPQHLLYLLARIVKGAVRYSSTGDFNQSADNRRSGMQPKKMASNIFGVNALFKEKTHLSSSDFREVIQLATKDDLIYMDPPYQGTSFTRDHRYVQGLPYDDFVEALALLNSNEVSYIISYDGHVGERTYGKELPKHLELEHLFVNAGRSSQITLIGGKDETYESLYLSPALKQRLSSEANGQEPFAEQAELAFG